MRSRHLPAIVLASIACVSASAAPVTYEFSSAWNGGYGSTLPEWYDFGIPFGTVVTGSFTVETETAPYFQNENVAQFGDLLTAATLTFGLEGIYGTYSLGGPAFHSSYLSNATMLDDLSFAGNPPYDQVGLGASLALVAGDPANFYRSFSLSAGTFDADIFTSAPSLDAPFGNAGTAARPLQFIFGVIQDDGVTEQDAQLFMEVTDLHVATASVPEPATLTLFGAGLLASLATRRRRRVRDA